MDSDTKLYWSLILLLAFSVGISSDIRGAVVVLVIGAAYQLYKDSAEWRHKHLNGQYKVQLHDIPRLGELTAEVTYSGAFEGSFDIDKLYVINAPSVDVWDQLEYVEKADVQREIRRYFRKLRGERE